MVKSGGVLFNAFGSSVEQDNRYRTSNSLLDRGRQGRDGAAVLRVFGGKQACRREISLSLYVSPIARPI